MDRSLIKTSKFLSLVLRHHPETIGIVLDPQGWVEIDRLLNAAQASGTPLTRELLLRVVRDNDKQRFALSEDGSRIRASQGHSVPVDLQLSPVQPPDRLFHGTVPRFIQSIRQAGLVPGSRQYVHLSQDRDTAVRVGSRRGRAVVLEVDAISMHRDGYAFYVSDNGVWLTERVPVAYLQIPES